MITIMNMLRRNFLKPAVVVLRGSDAARGTYKEALLALLKAELGDKLHLNEMSLQVMNSLIMSHPCLLLKLVHIDNESYLNPVE